MNKPTDRRIELLGLTLKLFPDHIIRFKTDKDGTTTLAIESVAVIAFLCCIAAAVYIAIGLLIADMIGATADGKRFFVVSFWPMAGLTLWYAAGFAGGVIGRIIRAIRGDAK